MRYFTFFVAFVFFFKTEQNFAQNLIQNGSFELGGTGNGFIVDGAGYNMLTLPFSGTTVNGNYAFSTNPILVNSTFLSGGDNTTGAGIMMIIDGNTVGGQQRFYKAGNNGGGVCGLTVGQTYTFSYWIKSISVNSNTVGTRANIGVQFNNTTSSQIQSGSTLAPHPNNGWQQVVYQFVPNNACVNIELFNNNTSATGNKFAIDDVAVLGPPNSIQFTHSIVQAGCGSPTNFIAIYAKGGTAPYTYQLTGAATLTNTIGNFDNLSPGTYNITVSDANNASISVPNVVVSANPSSGVLTQDTTICEGQAVQLITTNPIDLNDWVSTPNDPSLQSLNNTTFTATPNQTTTYSVGGSGSTNLIYNGSFQLGATGFFTQYNLLSVNPNAGQGVAGVTANSQTWFNSFDNCGDQDGTSTLFVADGATVANTVLWRQTVPVQPNTNYTFSYWATSVVNTAPSQLQVFINGTNSNTTTLTNNTCTWQNIIVNWNSGAASTATIDIINANLVSIGNDFAIDNLSFTKADNCDVTVTVIPSTPLALNPSHTFCLGGTIDLSVPNATNLVWVTPSGASISSNNLVINNAQNTHAGIYSVSVQGGGTCSLPAQTNVIISSGPTLTTTVQNVLCAGQSNGSASVNPVGNGPFTFAWSNGGNGQLIENLSPQIYSVTVTDANSCSSTISATVGEPEVLVISMETVDSECNQSNGSASVNISGGTSPFTISWSNGGTGNSVSNLDAGNHSVVVLDANSCQQTSDFTIGLLDGPNVTAISISDVNCFGNTNGSAEISVSGGSLPYTYTWIPNVSNNNVANNLSSGYYQVFVADNTGCQVEVNFTIEEPEALIILPNVSNPTCGLENGSISLQVTGGTGNYNFGWQPNVSSGAIATNLSAGAHSVVVTDDNGCTANFQQSLITVGSIPITPSSSSLTVQSGNTVNVGVFVGGGITNFDVSWSPQHEFVCSTCQFTQATPTENTTYSVTVTTPDGCSSTTTILVFVEIPCGELFLPSIFSPNKDGLNDEYCVLGSCLESLEFAIYNRWGEQVFYTNSQDKCWDGKFRGTDAPQGVYAYKITSTEPNGKVTISSGNITLVR